MVDTYERRLFTLKNQKKNKVFYQQSINHPLLPPSSLPQPLPPSTFTVRYYLGLEYIDDNQNTSVVYRHHACYCHIVFIKGSQANKQASKQASTQVGNDAKMPILLYGLSKMLFFFFPRDRPFTPHTPDPLIKKKKTGILPSIPPVFIEVFFIKV